MQIYTGKITVVCNQTGEKLVVKASRLSKESGDLTKKDLHTGVTQLILEEKGKARVPGYSNKSGLPNSSSSAEPKETDDIGWWSISGIGAKMVKNWSRWRQWWRWANPKQNEATEKRWQGAKHRQEKVAEIWRWWWRRPRTSAGGWWWFQQWWRSEPFIPIWQDILNSHDDIECYDDDKVCHYII